jgi:hypothetical protein
VIDFDAILALARAALADAERVQPAPWVEHERDFGNIIDDNGFHVCRTVALNDGSDHECEVCGSCAATGHHAGDHV